MIASRLLGPMPSLSRPSFNERRQALVVHAGGGTVCNTKVRQALASQETGIPGEVIRVKIKRVLHYIFTVK